MYSYNNTIYNNNNPHPSNPANGSTATPPTTTPDLQRYSQGSWGASPHASGTLLGRPTVMSSSGTQGGNRSTCRRSEALPRMSMAVHGANLFTAGGGNGSAFAARPTVGYVERDAQDSPALLWAGRPTMNFHPGSHDEDGGEVGRHTTLTYGGDSNERSGTLNGSARFSGSCTNVFGPPTTQLPPPVVSLGQDGNSNSCGYAPALELDETTSGTGGGTQTQPPMTEDVLAELESAPRKSYMKDGVDDDNEDDAVLGDGASLPPSAEETLGLPGFGLEGGWASAWGGGGMEGEEQAQDLQSLNRTVCAKTLAFQRASMSTNGCLLPDYADPYVHASLHGGGRMDPPSAVDYLREEALLQQQQAADDVVEQLQHLTMHASPTQKRLAFDDEPSLLSMDEEAERDGGEAPRTARSSTVVGPLNGGGGGGSPPTSSLSLQQQENSRSSVLPNFRFPPQKKHKLSGMALLQSRKRCLQEMLEEDANALPEAEAPPTPTEDVLSCTVTSTASSSGYGGGRGGQYLPVSSVLDVCRASGSSTNKENQALQCAPPRRNAVPAQGADNPLSVYAMCKRFRKEKLNAQCQLVNHSFPPMHSASASFDSVCPLTDREATLPAPPLQSYNNSSSTIYASNNNNNNNNIGCQEGRGSAAPNFLSPRNTNLTVPLACGHTLNSNSHTNNEEEGVTGWSPGRWREGGGERRVSSASPAERHARVRSCGDF